MSSYYLTDEQLRLRITDQLATISSQLASLSVGGGGIDEVAESPGGATRKSRPPLRDPRSIRKIIRHRQLRAGLFGGDLFAILLGICCSISLPPGPSMREYL